MKMFNFNNKKIRNSLLSIPTMAIIFFTGSIRVEASDGKEPAKITVSKIVRDADGRKIVVNLSNGWNYIATFQQDIPGRLENGLNETLIFANSATVDGAPEFVFTRKFESELSKLKLQNPDSPLNWFSSWSPNRYNFNFDSIAMSARPIEDNISDYFCSSNNLCIYPNFVVDPIFSMMDSRTVADGYDATDEKSRYGTYVFPDGNVCVGESEHGDMNGNAVCISNGKTYGAGIAHCGSFRNGIMVTGEILQVSPDENGKYVLEPKGNYGEDEAAVRRMVTSTVLDRNEVEAVITSAEKVSEMMKKLTEEIGENSELLEVFEKKSKLRNNPDEGMVTFSNGDTYRYATGPKILDIGVYTPKNGTEVSSGLLYAIRNALRNVLLDMEKDCDESGPMKAVVETFTGLFEDTEKVQEQINKMLYIEIVPLEKLRGGEPTAENLSKLFVRLTTLKQPDRESLACADDDVVDGEKY
jgi:hypothetical protein